MYTTHSGSTVVFGPDYGLVCTTHKHRPVVRDSASERERGLRSSYRDGYETVDDGKGHIFRSMTKIKTIRTRYRACGTELGKVSFAVAQNILIVVVAYYTVYTLWYAYIDTSSY